jgi:hypothetical protein
MDTSLYDELLCEQLRWHTRRYIDARVRELQHISDGDHLCKQLHIPYLEIDLPPGDHAGMLREARALEHLFIPHRGEESRGWKGLSLHGISARHTLSPEAYGYLREEDVPYVWTSAAADCPETTAWLRQLLHERVFDKFYRVRLMWLEPGGYIDFHQDRPDGAHSLGPLNVALNMPEGCHWVFKKWGKVPFRAGAGLCLDVSFAHSVWNNSSEPRVHLLLHGEYGPGYYRALATATAKLKAARLKRPKMSFALWNFWASGAGTPELQRMCRGLSTHFLSVHANHRYPFLQDHSLQRLLREASQHSDWCVVFAPGNIFKPDFISTLEAVIREMPEDVAVMGHLVDRDERGFGLHEQFMIVNLKHWQVLGEPHFAAPSGELTRVQQPERSAENVHDHYTPLWLKASGREYQIRPRVFGWNVLDRALKAGLRFITTPNSLRLQKDYLYPDDRPTSLRKGLENLLEPGFDLEALPVSDHQRGLLQRLRAESGGFDKNLFLFNNESYWQIEVQADKRVLDGLVTVASGFKDLFILHAHGHTYDTKIIYFDVCREALRIKRHILEHWDGRDFPAFLTRMRRDLQSELREAVHVVAESHWPTLWQEELRRWGGEENFRSAFLRARALPREFLHVDILEDSTKIVQALRETSGRQFAVWYSNCFNYTPAVARRRWDLEGIQERGLAFLHELQALALEQERNIVLYGEDIARGMNCEIANNQAADIFG